MFGFDNPDILLCLTIPIIYAFWKWLKKGHPIVLPFDHGKQTSGKGLFVFINITETLIPLIIVMGILIWCGPKKNAVPESEREMTNIQILLDCSGSMMKRFGDGLKPDGSPADRFDGAMEAIKGFVARRKGDAFGLTAFSDNVLHWVPLTKDTAVIADAAPFLRPHRNYGSKLKNIPGMGAGTSTGKGLLSCIPEMTKQPKGDRLIILVADGEAGDLRGEKPELVIQALKANNIKVHGIFINDQLPGPTFYNIVQGTGGDVFPAKDPATLNQVFKEIDKLQKVKLKQKAPLEQDNFFVFALIGLIFLGLHILASFGLRYTPW